MSPFWFVVLALVAYAVAYWGYGKWFDRTIWRPDPNRTTPAHMYTDGVEFFPVSRYVLWGYQFKSVAALGPVLGPFIAINYGWAPALAWLILGNFFIGWVQDYSSIMVSVRNQGRSFGPISYEFTGNAGRNTLLGFILFYLLIISATFIYLVSLFFNIFPGSFVATLVISLVGIVAGQMIYKMRMNIVAVTIFALVGMFVAFWLGTLEPLRWQVSIGANGEWNLLFWGVVTCIFLYLASVLPLPTFIQPINFIAFFPTFGAVILILIGALISPATGVTLQQPAWIHWYPGGFEGAGPIWPILFVAIACGAISGWHSLVGSSTTSKQLDVETDAHPIGAGAMLSEGLLGLASLACYMVLPRSEITNNIGSWVAGAQVLTQAFLGNVLGELFATVFFSTVLVLFAITVQALVTRFWRLVSAEVFGQSILAQKHVATIIGLAIPLLFAISGSWNNLWLYFGGSNQLLAGLALMLITIHLARTQAPSKYTFIPAMFMIITTLAALAWQTAKFAWAATNPDVTFVNPPLGNYPAAALILDWVFVLVGAALFALGIQMAVRTYRAYRDALSGGLTQPQPAAGSGD
ncbi:MAG: carbon starvation CstA family protein [Thermaerobacter sp.]|nr:carbon starvation protein A [Bacillota bacterium]REJ38146.1 MAG: carbon starvation protein A [Bacillota bacterium]